MISLSFGAGIGYTSAVLKELEKHYSEDQISWIATGTLLGSFLGPAMWSQITPRIGPKKSALVTGVPMLISWCLLLNIANFWCVMGGRVVKGIAMGALTATVPHYVSETAEDALRGTLGSIMVLTFNIGTLLVYGLGGFLDGFNLALVCAVIPIIFMIVFLPCPESPIYLLHNKRVDQGRLNLRRLRYPRDTTDELAIISTKTEVQEARWADVFKKKAARKTVGISIVMFAIQQISGIIALLSYVGDIFERAGGSIDPTTGSCIVGAVQVLGSLVGILLIERAGRRVIMVSSCVTMALSHGLLGYALMPDSNTPGWLPVTCLSIFMIGYAMGAAGAPYVIMNELSTPSMRPMVATINMVFMGCFTFLITKTYTDMIRLLSESGVFWLYASGCAAGAVFTFFFLPETAGKSNASIQEELEGRRTKQTA